MHGPEWSGRSAEDSADAQQSKQWRAVTAFNPLTSAGSSIDSALGSGKTLQPDNPQEPDVRKRTVNAERARQLGLSGSTPETAAAHRIARNSPGTGANNSARSSLGQAYQQAWSSVAKSVRELVGGNDDDSMGVIEESLDIGVAEEQDSGVDGDGGASPIKGASSDGRRAPAVPAARAGLAPRRSRDAPNRERKRRAGSSIEVDAEGAGSSGATSWEVLPELDDTPWASAAYAPDPLTGLPRVRGLTALKPLGQPASVLARGRLHEAAGHAGRSVVLWAVALITVAALVGTALLMFPPRPAAPPGAADPHKAQKRSPAERPTTR